MNQKDLITFIRDNRQKLRRGSFVFEDRFIYLETPKAACSTMKYILCELAGRPANPSKSIYYESSKEMSIHYYSVHRFRSLPDLSTKDAERFFNDKSALRVCTIRNPYSRIASTWAHKIRQGEPQYVETIITINKENGRTSGNPTFLEFLKWLSLSDKNLYQDPHWAPMSSFLFPETIKYTHLIRTENMAEELQQFLDDAEISASAERLLKKYKINESLPYSWKDAYTPEAKQIVENLYSKDFQTFGYNHEASLAKPRIKESLTETERFALELENKAIESISNRNFVIYQLIKKHPIETLISRIYIATLRLATNTKIATQRRLCGFKNIPHQKKTLSRTRKTHVSPKPISESIVDPD